MPLYDIFPAIDTTAYFVKWGSIVCVIILILLYALWRWTKRKKKKTRPYYLNILSHYDFNDSKRTANQLGYYGKFVVRTVQEEETLQYIITTLEPYKYNKKTIPLPIELQEAIQTFLAQLGSKDV